MKKFMPLIIIVVIVVVGSMIFSQISKRIAQKSAEGILEKTLERASGGKADVTMDRNGEKVEMKFKTEDGTLNINNKGELPSDFPKEIPIYPNAKISTSMTNPENESGSISFTTPDSYSDITKFYEEKLENDGWDIKSTFTSENSSFVSADKSNMSASIVATDDNEEGTTFVITYSKIESEE